MRPHPRCAQGCTRGTASAHRLLAALVCAALALAACARGGFVSPPCDRIDCSGHGACLVAPDGLPVCACDPGYGQRGRLACVRSASTADDAGGVRFDAGAGIDGEPEDGHAVDATRADAAADAPADAPGDVPVDTGGADLDPPDGPVATLAGAPTGNSAATRLAVTVGGEGVSSYRFQVARNAADCAAEAGYGAELPVAAPIDADISGVQDGAVCLCVLGRSAAGAAQAPSAATTASWVKDTVAPVVSGVRFDDGVHTVDLAQAPSFTWGRASDATSGVDRYEVAAGTVPGAEDVAPWRSVGTALTASLPGLALTAGATYYGVLRAVDKAGNVSAAAPGDGWYVGNAVPGTTAAAYTVVQGDSNPVTLSPLLGDADPDNDALSIVAVSQPAAGTATVSLNQVVYTSTDPGFTGVDSFSYTVADGYGGVVTETIRVEVQPLASWRHRKPITISAALSPGADLVDFPFLLALSGDADLQAGAQASGADILFVLADAALPLRHEIEAYDPSTGALTAWIKIPSLPSGQAVDVDMYYDNPAALDMQRGRDVFDARHLAVWHMSDDPSLGTDGPCQGEGGGLCESTRNRRHASVGQGIVDREDLVPGLIGQAIDFDAATIDMLDYPCAGCPGYPVTLSAWFRPRTLAGLVATYGGLNLTIAMTGRYLHVGPSRNMTGVPLTQLAVGTWHHVTAVYRAEQDIQVFLDGVDRTEASDDYWNASGNHIGSRGRPNCCGPPLAFDGVLDEVRVLGAAMSAEEIDAAHRNQRDPGAWITVHPPNP